MSVYLVQHGQAKTEDEDPERSLTDRGVDDAGRVARLSVDRLGVRAGLIFHSGRTRARQTAEIWGRLLGVAVEQGDALAPNDDPATWAERLAGDADGLILVGHLPHLGRLAALLLTGDSDDTVISFRPGGLVGLERAGTGWAVSVVLPPEAA